MSQVETLPQSMADMKTIVLKPRLDRGDVRLIGEKIKPSLFARFGFKSKPEDVRLLAAEMYFEPYLIIAGKYFLDYVRKHVFEVNVQESTTKIFVAGQEFRSEQSHQKTSKKVVKMMGEEYAHHERQAYYVLDRVKREILPEKLPISPFEQEENIGQYSSFKSINISDEVQVEFLKAKIAKRPADVAEIIREVFDITDRTIAYYPMYQLTYENMKNRKDATVSINCITGEVILNGTKKLAVKTIVDFDQGTETQVSRAVLYEENPAKPILNTNLPETTPAAETIPEQETVKLTQPVETIASEETQGKIILDINLAQTTGKENTPLEEVPIQPTEPPETPAHEESTPEPILNANSPDTTHATEPTLEEESAQPIQPDTGETMVAGFPARISGEVFSVGDNVTAVVGDMEVPSGTNVNKTLVVKGALRIGDNCKVHGKLKALRAITLGADTIIDGDVISGGNVLVGPGVLITGKLQAGGYIQIGKQATIEQGLCSDPRAETPANVQLDVDMRNTVASVAHET